MASGSSMNGMWPLRSSNALRALGIRQCSFQPTALKREEVRRVRDWLLAEAGA